MRRLRGVDDNRDSQHEIKEVADRARFRAGGTQRGLRIHLNGAAAFLGFCGERIARFGLRYM
jgi:hypothetical protein